MCETTRGRLAATYDGRFSVEHASLEECSVRNASQDFIAAFNLVHIVGLAPLLNRARALLRPDGLLFVYTRLLSQEAESIWGRYFPDYLQHKAERFGELEELQTVIEQSSGAKLIEVERFSYRRQASLSVLTSWARSHSYSTFTLYDPSSFDRVVDTFAANVAKDFHDAEAIEWNDKDVMLVIAKLD
jgi:hypothetical protein